MHSTELDAAPANPLAAEQMAPNVGGAEGFPAWPVMPPAKFDGEDVLSFLSSFERHADYLRIFGKDRCKRAASFMSDGYAVIFKGHAKNAGDDWDKAKASFLSLFEEEEVGKTPRQVAEEYLARPFDMEKEPIKQIMMVEQLIGFVSDWAVDKINQLLWFIPRAWVDEIMRDPDAADSFSNTAKRVKAIAKRHEKLQALYRRKDDKGTSAESKEKLSRKSTVSSVPRVAEPSKDHSRDREIDDLRDKLARLTLKFEAMSKERETVRFTCYYCAEEGHRTGNCAALREDMAKGLVQEIAGRYCFLPGEQLPRSNSK